MKWWRDLPANQRRLLLIGVPLVAVAALVSVLRRPSPAPDTDEPSAAAAGVMPPTAAPAMDAIGVGQLASFEDALTGQIDEMYRYIEERTAATPADDPDQAETPAAPSVPAGGFRVDPPADGIGTYTIDNQLVRVGGDPSGGDAHARAIAEYGAAGGRDGVIDSTADVRFVERARGRPRNDPQTARMILNGSFGPVSASFRPTLERVASS